jgi:uncharacterized membrane protein
VTHGHSHDEPPRVTARTEGVLWAVVGLILAIVGVGLAFTWPSNLSQLGSQQFLDEGATWEQATVLSVDDSGTMTVQVHGQDGTAEVQPPGVAGVEVKPGDVISVVRLQTGDVIFSDFHRTQPMVLLLVLYILAVLLVARWRGLGALLGLAFALGIVAFYTVPALLNGSPPIIVGLVTGAGALCVLLYVAHGFNARTTTAYLGTIAGLLVTAGLGWWAVGAAHIPGVPSDAEINVSIVTSAVSLSGLALCGVMLAGLGVLNDVTVTQASAVWELRRARPDLGRIEVYKRAMRVGRDHIASTVYTIAFAYVGSALPLIVLILVYNNSIGNAITSSEIAGEIVRTLVGSLGLVLAVPLTTMIGAIVAAPGSAVPEATGRRALRIQREVAEVLDEDGA